MKPRHTASWNCDATSPRDRYVAARGLRRRAGERAWRSCLIGISCRCRSVVAEQAEQRSRGRREPRMNTDSAFRHWHAPWSETRELDTPFAKDNECVPPGGQGNCSPPGWGSARGHDRFSCECCAQRGKIGEAIQAPGGNDACCRGINLGTPLGTEPAGHLARSPSGRSDLTVANPSYDARVTVDARPSWFMTRTSTAQSFSPRGVSHTNRARQEKLGAGWLTNRFVIFR
jgi:hypothetical protein